jgi:small subunit ribosomal protein S15
MTPSWLTYSPDEITTLIVKLAKDGFNPSQIGLELRNEYNIPLVKPILGMSIRNVLEENGIKQSMPEDLDALLNSAKRLKDHLKRNKGDRKNVRSLELLEAKIHRLSKYYKRKGLLQKSWKYSAVIAQLA